jgi:hypothetical protein
MALAGPGPASVWNVTCCVETFGDGVAPAWEADLSDEHAATIRLMSTAIGIDLVTRTPPTPSPGTV